MTNNLVIVIFTEDGFIIGRWKINFPWPDVSYVLFGGKRYLITDVKRNSKADKVIVQLKKVKSNHIGVEEIKDFPVSE